MTGAGQGAQARRHATALEAGVVVVAAMLTLTSCTADAPAKPDPRQTEPQVSVSAAHMSAWRDLLEQASSVTSGRVAVTDPALRNVDVVIVKADATGVLGLCLQDPKTKATVLVDTTDTDDRSFSLGSKDCGVASMQVTAVVQGDGAVEVTSGQELAEEMLEQVGFDVPSALQEAAANPGAEGIDIKRD